MYRSDGSIARSERRIREDEERIVRLRPLLEWLERTGHARAAAEAGRVLAETEAALALRRDRLGLPSATALARAATAGRAGRTRARDGSAACPMRR